MGRALPGLMGPKTGQGSPRNEILATPLVNRDPLDKSFTHVWRGVHLHVRTCTPRFPDLANGWADRVQILCVNRDPLDKSFTHVCGGVHPRLRTCTPLCHDGDYSLTRPITFKFGGSLPEPGHGGSFSGLGDCEASRNSETAELTRTRMQRDWKAPLGDGSGAVTSQETAELAQGRRQRNFPGHGDSGAGKGSERQSWPKLRYGCAGSSSETA